LAVQLGLDEQTAVEQFVEEFTRMKSELENDSEN
jgi:hypothetical protein